MGRVLAVDYGKKRTGLAVTDPMQVIATPLDTIATSVLMDFLKKYEQGEGFELLVVGMPKNLQNTQTHATPLVNNFVKSFKKHFPEKNVVMVDERFTSKMAFDAMLAGGIKKKGRRDKAMIDKISATIILQSYLDSKGAL